VSNVQHDDQFFKLLYKLSVFCFYQCFNEEFDKETEFYPDRRRLVRRYLLSHYNLNRNSCKNY